jgi:hypothetical protein
MFKKIYKLHVKSKYKNICYITINNMNGNEMQMLPMNGMGNNMNIPVNMNNMGNNMNMPTNIPMNNMGGNMNMPANMPMNMPSNGQSDSLVNSLFSGNLSGSTTGSSIREIQQYHEQPQEHISRPSHLRRSVREDKNNIIRNNNRNNHNNEIRNLARNVNKSLDSFEPSKVHTDEDVETDGIEENDKKKLSEKDKNEDEYKDENYSILTIGKEMALLIIIYVILSQGFVRKTIAGYVPQINATSDGTVPIVGYFIYGSILAILFIFFRYTIIK